MTAVLLSTAKDTLADLIHQVAEKHEPVMIKAEDGKMAVLVSLEDFEEMDTTTYLMSNPTNRERLLRGIETFKAGRGVVRELDLDS